jgi:hypothetical protein
MAKITNPMKITPADSDTINMTIPEGTSHKTRTSQWNDFSRWFKARADFSSPNLGGGGGGGGGGGVVG